MGFAFQGVSGTTSLRTLEPSSFLKSRTEIRCGTYTATIQNANATRSLHPLVCGLKKVVFLRHVA